MAPHHQLLRGALLLLLLPSAASWDWDFRTWGWSSTADDSAAAPPSRPLSPKTLVVSAHRGELAAVLQSLDEGNHPDVPHGPGVTALYGASEQGHIAVVALLLERGADPTKPTDAGITPLFIASQNNHVAVVGLLVARPGVDVNRAVNADGVTALFIASQLGHREVVLALVTSGSGSWRSYIDEGKEPGANQVTLDGSGSTPLLSAVQEGHAEVVTVLLGHGGGDPEKATKDGSTPLMIAVKKGHTAVVRALLEHGADVNRSPASGTRIVGMTPLILASFESRDVIMEVLLRGGADVNLAMGANDVTALEIAMLKNHVACVAVLKRWGAKDNGMASDVPMKPVGEEEAVGGASPVKPVKARVKISLAPRGTGEGSAPETPLLKTPLLETPEAPLCPEHGPQPASCRSRGLVAFSFAGQEHRRGFGAASRSFSFNELVGGTTIHIEQRYVVL